MCGFIVVLTVHKIGGADSRGYADYLASIDPQQRGDYYLGREGEQGVSPGQWYGRAAKELGLSGTVEKEVLLNVWAGRDPITGKELVRRSMRGEHVAAVDCTFSAPKSVSVVWALAEPVHRMEIEAAHEQAVECALRHIEKEAPLARRRVDHTIQHEQVAGLVVARFRHHTSRLSTEHAALGLAPDPQLHDHCAIANLALRKSDASANNGRWAAIDSRELFLIRAEAGAIYRADLAHRLMEMGYRVHREGRYFEINGVSRDVMRAFSARAVEVEAAEARFVASHGRQPTTAEKRSMVVRTRSAKSADHRPAFEQWAQRAAVLGLEPEAIQRLKGTPREMLPEYRAQRIILRELTDIDSEQSVTRDASVVTERALRIAAAEAAQGRMSGEGASNFVPRIAMGGFGIVPLADERVTTREMLQLEQKVLNAALARGRTETITCAQSATASAIEAARVSLSEEQIRAVERLRSGNGFLLLTAPAGSGKGEVLRVVTQAHQAEDRQVMALAAAGETAQRLGRELGADQSRTIDSFISSVETAGIKPDASTVLVVDEAALVETRRWYKLLEAAGEATIIAAGDDHQLSPIQAGGIWGVMERQLGATTLQHNYRANDEWARDAWLCLREGSAPSALEEFERRELIELQPTRPDARVAAVEKWNTDRRLGMERGKGIEQFLLLTDSSNHEVDALNRLAQEHRLSNGELGVPMVHISARDTKSGHQREEDLHERDRVQFERRYKPQAGRRIENGATGSVVAVDTEHESVTVRVGARDVVVERDGLDALRLGYAQHVYSAQGRTVDNSYVVLGGWQTDRERSYVGLSRSREKSVIISDYDSLGIKVGAREEALAVLGERCAVSQRKVAALSLMERVTDPHVRRSLEPRSPDDDWERSHQLAMQHSMEMSRDRGMSRSM